MGRNYSQNESGFKQKLHIKLDGVMLERGFRNKGEAISYLQKVMRVQKYEFGKRVQFINN